MITITSSRAYCLGRVALRPTTLTTVTPTKRADYSTFYQTSQRSGASIRPPSLAQQTPLLSSCTKGLQMIRAASTSTNTSTPAPASASQPTQTTLTWNEFLKLRRTRRYVNLGASIFSGVGTIAVATPLIAEYEIETIGAQLTGLDPMFVIGGSLMAVGGVGWLMGPFLGTAFFKVWKSSVATEFARVSCFPFLSPGLPI